MITCTEFIPLYSEFFKYLEEREGHDAVLAYWYHISDTSIGDKTNPNSMAYHCDRLGGYKGAIKYWSHTTTEEACDTFGIANDEKGYRFSIMRYCPSRGMLNALKHVEPYYDYCEHCKIIYSRVLEKYGCKYERNQSEVANARCSSVLYHKDNPPDFDIHNLTEADLERMANEPGAVVSECKREGKKYLHRDFHLLGDNALSYCGMKYGDEAVIDFLTSYVKNFYSPQIAEIKERGLVRLKEWIENIYTVEEASDVLHTELEGNRLTVTIDKSPVIEFMHSLNQEPGKYYIEQTRTLYRAIADECGFKFNLEYYKEDGATKFTFEK